MGLSLMEQLATFQETLEGTSSTKVYRAQLRAEVARRKQDEWDEEDEEQTVTGLAKRLRIQPVDEEAVTGSLKWDSMEPPSFLPGQQSGVVLSSTARHAFETLKCVSQCFVDYMHLSIEGKKRWVLSWPFLLWPHSLPGMANPRKHLEMCAYNNVLQDQILRLAAVAVGVQGGDV